MCVAQLRGRRSPWPAAVFWATVLALVVPADVVADCGMMPLLISHRTAQIGAFQIEEYSGNRTGPQIRFWQYGNYAGMNSGGAGQFDPGREWLVSPASMGVAGFGPADFVLFQAAFLTTDLCYDFPTGVPPTCDGSVNLADFTFFQGHFLHGPGGC